MEPSNLTAGDILDAGLGFDAVELYRRGGQKQVFRCDKDKQTWALKVIRASTPSGNGVSSTPDSTETDESFARAEREVKVMRECNSSYLVKLGPIDLSKAMIGGEYVYYFTEEWIEGEDLKSILAREGRLTVRETARLGLQIASAIEILAAKRIVHRDIKPQNIMRRAASGDYVLLDLGIALDLEGDSITQTGQWVRSPGYVAPEQMNPSTKHTMDHRSDMFVLGIVLYEALTGQHPFKARGMLNDVNENIRTYNARPASTVRSDIPSKFDEILKKLLGKHQHLRYKKCDRLIRELSELE